ncbi:MAG: hypothetical protein IJR95_06410 [Lachnospiraceae bacterium]|nr:hypothetical protein [Lachnospiraceae bacterium]
MADHYGGSKRPEENRKSAHVGRKAAGTAVILALLAGGGYFGFGVGNPNGGWLTPSNPGITQEAPPQTTAVPATTLAPVQTTAQVESTTADDGILRITVKESGILYRGQSVSLAELEQALLKDYKAGDKAELTDDHAIKAVYDEVTALLNKLQIPLK